jgi:hypothetical protein
MTLESVDEKPPLSGYVVGLAPLNSTLCIGMLPQMIAL